MRLARSRRPVRKHRGIEAVQHPLYKKLCCQIEYLDSVHILVKCVVESVLFLPRPALANLIFAISIGEIFRVLQNDNFFVQYFDQVELAFKYFLGEKRAKTEGDKNV